MMRTIINLLIFIPVSITNTVVVSTSGFNGRKGKNTAKGISDMISISGGASGRPALNLAATFINQSPDLCVHRKCIRWSKLCGLARLGTASRQCSSQEMPIMASVPAWFPKRRGSPITGPGGDGAVIPLMVEMMASPERSDPMQCGNGTGGEDNSVLNSPTDHGFACGIGGYY